MGYTIEKNISLPKAKSGAEKKYPFGEMGVGDSFICGEYSPVNMTRIGNAARNWGKLSGRDIKFCLRKTADNKIRIWRVV